MYELLNIFRIVFNYIFWISLICTCFIEFRRVFIFYKKETDNGNISSEKKNEPKKVLESIYFILAMLLIIVGELVILKFNENLWWLLLIVAIPTFTKIISELLSALDVVFSIAKNNDARHLSILEKFSLIIVAYLWFTFGNVKMFRHMLDMIEQCENALVHDFFVVLFFSLVLSIYFFLIFSLIYPIIVCFFMFLQFIYSRLPWKAQISRICDDCLVRENNSFKHVSVLMLVVEKARKKNWLIRIASWLIHIVLFSIDIVTKTVLILTEWLCMFIGRFLSSVRFIKRKIARLCHFINNLSDMRLVGFSFRLALVFSLTLIVALNRYKSMFAFQEASTAFLEFIASAIIIPIGFECVYSMKKRTSKQRE